MKSPRMENIYITVLLILGATIFCSCSTLGSSIPSGYTQYGTETSNLYIRNDEFKNVSFIQHKYFFNIFIDHPISVYIAKTQSAKLLRAVFSYDGSDWIFFENAIIINNSGERLARTFKSYDKNTDVGSGGHVYESIDIVLTDAEVSQLMKLLEAGNVKIRLSGKYYKEYSLNEDYINALMEILRLYIGM